MRKLLYFLAGLVLPLGVRAQYPQTTIINTAVRVDVRLTPPPTPIEQHLYHPDNAFTERMMETYQAQQQAAQRQRVPAQPVHEFEVLLMRTTKPVNLYASPRGGSDNTVLMTLPVDATLDVIYKQGEPGFRVNYFREDKRGYVWNEFLELYDPSQPDFVSTVVKSDETSSRASTSASESLAFTRTSAGNPYPSKKYTSAPVRSKKSGQPARQTKPRTPNATPHRAKRSIPVRTQLEIDFDAM